MRGIYYQLKSILKDKFCLMTFLLPIVVAIALNFMGSIDMSPVGELHFCVVKDEFPGETITWLARYGTVNEWETWEEVAADIREPSTNVIGVRAKGSGMETVIAGDELEIFQQTASSLPSLYAGRQQAAEARVQVLPRPDLMEGLENLFIPAVLITAMFMGCTFNAMNIISEKEDGVAFINEILPMTNGRYLLQKVTAGFLCGGLSSLVTAWICFGFSWKKMGILLALIGLSSFVAALLGLLIGKYSQGMMVGVVYIKIVMLVFLAVPILCTLLGVNGIGKILCSLVPSQPAFAGILAVAAGDLGKAWECAGVLLGHGGVWVVLYLVVAGRRRDSH